MWIIYIIQHTTTKQIYIGVTQDLKRRLSEHNSGNQRATKRNSGEWLLIYAEAYRSKSSAYERERKLKQYGSAKQKLFKRISKCMVSE